MCWRLFIRKSEATVGIPQGSVLRPQLFTLHSSPVANIARKDGFSVQLYADDKQLYLAFKPPDVTSATRIKSGAVRKGNQSLYIDGAHRLMLNENKSVIPQMINQLRDPDIGILT